jgi:hypothetical protein
VSELPGLDAYIDYAISLQLQTTALTEFQVMHEGVECVVVIAPGAAGVRLREVLRAAAISLDPRNLDEVRPIL